jgi:hypothetical protein
MNTKTQLTIAAQALEQSIGGQAACLRAVELTLEALAQPEPEVAMMREWKPRRMSAEEMQSENTRLQASLEECSGNCTALKDQVRRMRSELERPMSSEATVLVHDNAQLRADVQALRGAVPAGWKLVPVEPTEEMLDAADAADREYTRRNFGDVMTVIQGGAYDHWCAMVAAAPQPAAQPDPTPERLIAATVPAATARDRWFYEQGRLAERDPRTMHAEPAQGEK